jgi:hypothetical protein
MPIQPKNTKASNQNFSIQAKTKDHQLKKIG